MIARSRSTAPTIRARRPTDVRRGRDRPLGDRRHRTGDGLTPHRWRTARRSRVRTSARVRDPRESTGSDGHGLSRVAPGASATADCRHRRFELTAAGFGWSLIRQLEPGVLRPANRELLALLGPRRGPALQDPQLHGHHRRAPPARAVRARDRPAAAGPRPGRRPVARRRARRDQRRPAAVPVRVPDRAGQAARGRRPVVRRRAAGRAREEGHRGADPPADRPPAEPADADHDGSGSGSSTRPTDAIESLDRQQAAVEYRRDYYQRPARRGSDRERAGRSRSPGTSPPVCTRRRRRCSSTLAGVLAPDPAGRLAVRDEVRRQSSSATAPRAARA